MHVKLRGLLLLSFVLLALGGTEARAQAAAPGDFEKGMTLYRAHDWQAAVPWLEAASQSTPRAMVALAFCYRQLHRFAQAKAVYQRYLRTHPDDAARAEAMVAQTDEESRAWHKLHPGEPEPADAPAPVPAATASATSAAPAAAAPAPSAISAEPAHAPATAPGPAISSATAAPRDSVPAVAVVPAAAPSADRGHSALPWIAGGAAVAAIGAGVAFGLSSRSSANEISSGPHSSAEVDQLDSDVASKARTGNVLLGVGAGLAVVSAGLFLFHF